MDRGLLAEEVVGQPLAKPGAAVAATRRGSAAGKIVRRAPRRDQCGDGESLGVRRGGGIGGRHPNGPEHDP